MKSLFQFFGRGLLLFSFLAAGPVLQAGGVKLGSDVWPPFTDQEGRSRVALDLVAEALKRSGLETQVEILDFAEVISGLKDGKLDGSAAIWRNPERENFLLFSKPYLENRLILVGRKGSNVSAGSFAELKGKTVGIVGSYAYGNTLDENSGAHFLRGKDDQENLVRLLSGEIDYMLVDSLLIQYLLENQPNDVKKYLSVGDKALVTRPLHFALRKNYPGALEIMEKFNTTMRSMILDGTLQRILNVKWVRTDVDNDGKTELIYRNDKIGKTPPTLGYSLLTQGDSAAPPPQVPAAKKNLYYIGGTRYDSWESIPDSYKIDDTGMNVGTSGGVPVLKFSY